LFEITQATIARIYGFVNYKLISLNIPIGYGIGPMRNIQWPHPLIKREAIRRPKSTGPHVSLEVSRSPEIPNPSREQDAAVLSLLTAEYPDGVRDFDTSTCDCERAAKISFCASIFSA
jgi:hypothetical protein